MQFIRYIINFFRYIRFRFRNSIRKKETIQRIREQENRRVKDVNDRIEALINQEEENTEQVKKIIEEKTSIEIGKQLGQQFKELVFDLVEIEEEVNVLNQKLFDIEKRKQRVDSIQIPSTSKTDEDIDRLEKIFQGLDHKKGTTSFHPNSNDIENWNDNEIKVDNFFEEYRLIKIYTKREEKREHEEKVKQQKINELLRQIEQTINSNKNVQSKQNIRIAEKAVLGLRDSKQKIKFRKKISILIETFRNREIEEESKRQSAKLKQDREAADKKRKEEEKRLEEKIKQRQKEEKYRREKEQDSKNKEKRRTEQLQKLIVKKANWKEFEKVLHENGITKFYHFTDRINIESIKKNGGLYSWYYCDKNGINITKSGGDTLSRDLDRRHSLQDYVRLSFCNDHPMQYRLSQSGYNLILLEVAIGVAYFEHSRFSDMNATDNNHSHGHLLSDLKNVNFSATKRSYVRKEDPEFKHHQAEILVKTWIPIDYINNINQFFIAVHKKITGSSLKTEKELICHF